MPSACLGEVFLNLTGLAVPQREEADSPLSVRRRWPAFGHGMIDSLPYLATHNAGVSR
jgi:hypothetical protein